MRRASLTVGREIPAGLAAAAGDPAVFLCLVHRLLVRCAAGRETEGQILVRVEGTGIGIAVRLIPAGEPGASAAPARDDEDVDRELASRLGAGLTFEGGGAATIRLTTVR